MWPASRRSKSKLFLPLINGKSLFEKSYEALRLRYNPEDIFIQTTHDQAYLARQQAPEIPESNYFIEPALRNTGPAIGFMAAKLYEIAPDEPFMVVQSDILRTPADKFIKMMEAVDKLVRKEKKLITSGFKPEKATMGVDYLIRKEKTIKKGGVVIHEMDKWLGRDTKEKVSDYVKDGLAFLHANHYAWTPREMLDAYKRHRPDWYEHLQKIIDALGTREEGEVIKHEYSMMAPGPTEDVTKFELENGFVVELDFDWVDFGTWESVDSRLNQDEGQIACKNVLEIDSVQNYVSAASDKFVATIGVKDMVIIDSGDALLVCKKDQSGRVGEIVDYLEGQDMDHLL